MRHAVTPTSQLAFDLLSLRKVSALHLAILRTVREANDVVVAAPVGRPVCRKMIAIKLGVPFNSISGRFTELLKAGLLAERPEPHVTFDGRRHAWLEITEAGRLAAMRPVARQAQASMFGG